MKRPYVLLAALAVLAAAGIAGAAAPDNKPLAPPQNTAQDKYFKPEERITNGAAAGVDYQAIAGTLVVHPRDFDDVVPATDKADKKTQANNPDAEASMFFVAYLKRGADAGSRPITFFYNGGPGSSTVWLHMGAFGPRRVVTADDTHTPAAPYRVVDNDYSLLDASDLVFIDAPGTGFGRIAGKDKEKAFYGVDQDAYAFSRFIAQFLSKYGRWNSPKFLFGESYGTPRSAVLVNMLETEDDIDFNGVILLSQILNFDLSADGPEGNPGIDLPYQLALPTYAATAWYHHSLPGNRPADLGKFLGEVQHFAMGDYAQALQAGAALNKQQRMMTAQKLHQYTGLPVWYILKADLRINGGEFEKTLQDQTGTTTGRLDTRFSGPSMDPLSKEADYDPQSAAISSAYVSGFNDYVRRTLNFGQDRVYQPEIDVFKWWDFKHKQPGQPFAFPGVTNTIPDLSSAMKYNPNLKIMLNGGYFDLATPYYEGIYEMRHMQIPQRLQSNISYRYYQSGHMVYAHEESLKDIHDGVSDFIRRNSNSNR